MFLGPWRFAGTCRSQRRSHFTGPAIACFAGYTENEYGRTRLDVTLNCFCWTSVGCRNESTLSAKNLTARLLLAQQTGWGRVARSGVPDPSSHSQTALNRLRLLGLLPSGEWIKVPRPNPMAQRTGASRFALRQIKHPRRLAPVADLCVKVLTKIMNTFLRRVAMADSRPMSAEHWRGWLLYILVLGAFSAFLSRHLPASYGIGRQFGLVLTSMLLFSHCSRWPHLPRSIMLPLRLLAIVLSVAGTAYMCAVTLDGI
jgi:hypothetical protein